MTYERSLLAALIVTLGACGDDAPPMSRCPAGFEEVEGTCVAFDGGVPDGCVASDEVCDALDNDCDGRLDEDLRQACGTDVGACRAGIETCFAGAWEGCDATPPAADDDCDSPQDEDCDGEFDEGCGCTAGESRPCGETTGECASGTQRCTSAATWGSCDGATGPAPELCDGLDNDCDGVADEDEPESGIPCGSDAGECSPGVQMCVAGRLVCNGEVGPGDETCDGLDNDCDMSTDEGVTTTFYADGDMDTYGDPSDAVQACSVPARYVDNADDCDDMVAARYDGAPEICDGLDNDCSDASAAPDATFDCIRGGAVVCTTSCESTGTGACTDACEVPEGDDCTPPAEACNYSDDDCDGRVDEGLSAFSAPAVFSGATPIHRTRVIRTSSGFLILWDSTGGLMVRRLSATGTALGAAVRVTTSRSTTYDVSVIDDTTAVVAWSSAGGIFARRLSFAGSGVSLLGGEVELEGDVRSFQVSGVAVAASAGEIYYAYASTTYEVVLARTAVDLTDIQRRTLSGFSVPPVTSVGDVYGQFDLDASASGFTLAFTRRVSGYDAVSVGRVSRNSITLVLELSSVTNLGLADSQQPRVVSSSDGTRLVSWVRRRAGVSNGELGFAEFAPREWTATTTERAFVTGVRVVESDEVGTKHAAAFVAGKWQISYATNLDLRIVSLVPGVLTGYDDAQVRTTLVTDRAGSVDVAGDAGAPAIGAYADLDGTLWTFRMGCL